MRAMSTIAGAEITPPGNGPRHRAAANDSGTAQDRYSTAIGFLRAFVTVLVVAHHAVLAYVDFAPAATLTSLVPEPRWWQALPVVDGQRWAGFSLFVSFNDTFFMALMFFLSGLFTWSSLTKKGTGRFLRDRWLRLGVPFVIAAAVLAPVAYSTAYLTRTQAPTVTGFWQQWLALGTWPAGPAWFLWVLLAFDLLATAVFLATSGRGILPAQALSRLARRPLPCFVVLVTASTVAYVPLVMVFGPMHWVAAGPFTVQTSRVLHYAVYFAAGVALGASPLGSGLLAPEGALARRWGVWSVAALVTFVAGFAVVSVAIVQPSPSILWGTIGGLAFALSCAATSFGLLAAFLRFARRRTPVLDSLRLNAYGIYLVHYGAVAWLQYSLLNAPMSGLVKGVAVFACATALSWAVTAALRRVPMIGWVI